MSSHADLLGRLLGRHIRFVPDVCGDVALNEIRSMNQGDMILLDNVRGWSEENELKKAISMHFTNLKLFNIFPQ